MWLTGIFKIVLLIESALNRALLGTTKHTLTKSFQCADQRFLSSLCVVPCVLLPCLGLSLLPACVCLLFSSRVPSLLIYALDHFNISVIFSSAPEFSIQVGMFGVTTQDTPFLSPQCGPGVRFDPVLPAALQQTQFLRASPSRQATEVASSSAQVQTEGTSSSDPPSSPGPARQTPVDVVLALTHLSFSEDLKLVLLLLLLLAFVVCLLSLARLFSRLIVCLA